ncbi:ATP-binding protein [Chryseobacterium shigense]|uniref:DNA repair ATPase RecN n=1 Tax=Chryseobacterium shigense TaxID=297244 RepID=A0A841NFV1_9FLAO|nr:ATP-binding protein [Chryseobacterium shigense]MBB6372738.1 DNA repair ATPase RecN [Chryseobacterium shigense]
MLKINKIKFEVNTSSGLYGSKYEFSNGLNIIRADNTSGKSSLFQAITYCLGFEEIIGGRNEKTMQSVFRDQVEYPKDSFHKVIQSFVYLEIENSEKEIITIKRSVISNSDRKPQLVDVYFGKLIDDSENIIPESKPMYIHDKGGATDEIYGFHLFLENFLNWSLPNVLTNSGDSKKLYIQQVASSFMIEQKSGWSDFFATMPHFSLSNKEARAIEFLLNLDVTENKKRKQQITFNKRIIEDKWSTLNNQFIRLAEKGGGRISGIEQKPVIINDYSRLNILLTKDEGEHTISDYIDLQVDELNNLQTKSVFSVGQNISNDEDQLEKLNNFINKLSINYELLSTELSFDIDRLSSYRSQLSLLKSDLRKNKGALKVKNLGADFNLKTSTEICPTCNQEINDSLLPLEVEQIPMRLEDNIDFIDAQIKMISVYIEGQEKTINEKEKRIDFFKTKLSEARTNVRLIKKELVSDERLPSIIEIENRLNLKKRIEFYNKFLEDFNELVSQLKELSKQWEKIISDESNLPTNFFSINDNEKLQFLELKFKALLKEFNYTSQQSEFIKISRENYLPVISKPFGEETKDYNIRFDSSGSDFIRCIWAYTFSLLDTSIKFDGNHPRLIMMDEPKQQDAAIENFHSFLKTISKHKESQILIFASFENSDEAFNTATKGVDFNLIYIEDKLIKPIT